MDRGFYLPMEVFNGILLACFAVVPVVVLVLTTRADWGVNRVAQMSLRARLPIGSASIRHSIRERTRTLTRANMWGVLAAVGVVGSMFVLTPLGMSPSFLWFLALGILLVTMAVSAAVVTTRERLFSPAPAAPRVARARALTTRDYIGRACTLIPIGIFIGAGVLIACVVVAFWAGAVAPGLLLWIAAATLIAVTAGLLGRWAERRVLAQPQPATDTLELAWDDLFRGDALSTLRMGAAMAAWLPFGVGVSILMRAGLPFASTGWEATLGVFPWWGIPILQLVYTMQQGRLPRDLYPDWLRQPSPAGAPA
ncbi:MAG: hypothetical protein WBX17_07750 [Microbacterium sp.]